MKNAHYAGSSCAPREAFLNPDIKINNYIHAYFYRTSGAARATCVTAVHGIKPESAV
jgi:hypothetical protein